MIVKTESPEQFCLHAFFFQNGWTAINISLWYYYVNFIQSFHQFWLKRNSAKKVRNIYTILFSLLTVSNYQVKDRNLLIDKLITLKMDITLKPLQ